MTLHRAYVEPQWMHLSSENTLLLPIEAAHRFFRVLRLKENEWVEVFDGSGKSIQGQLFSATKPMLVNCHEVLEKSKKNQTIVVAQALIPASKLEYVIQKATELGVDQILLFETAHSLVKGKSTPNSKYERWMRIAQDAARQCQRTDVPAILGPISFDTLLQHCQSFDGFVCMGDLKSQTLLSKALKSQNPPPNQAMVIIGPEGDFSSIEHSRLLQSNIVGVRFCPYVLRTETAALVAVSVIHAFFGNA